MALIPDDGVFYFTDVTAPGKKPNEDLATQFRLINYQKNFTGLLGTLVNEPYREVWSHKGADIYFATDNPAGHTKGGYGLRTTSELTGKQMTPVFPTPGYTINFKIPSKAFTVQTTGQAVGDLFVQKTGTTDTPQKIPVYRVNDKDGGLGNRKDYGDFYVMYVASPKFPPKK